MRDNNNMSTFTVIMLCAVILIGFAAFVWLLLR